VNIANRRRTYYRPDIDAAARTRRHPCCTRHKRAAWIETRLSRAVEVRARYRKVPVIDQQKGQGPERVATKTDREKAVRHGNGISRCGRRENDADTNRRRAQEFEVAHSGAPLSLLATEHGIATPFGRDDANPQPVFGMSYCRHEITAHAFAGGSALQDRPLPGSLSPSVYPIACDNYPFG
jgi:hypothetical protein